jgi:predicted glycosyltransferase
VRVWVDLTNSPHVLVLRPVVEALRARGAEVEVTARDFAQTVELADRFGLRPEVIGRHRGGRVAAKAAGLAPRARALVRWARSRLRRLERAADVRLEKRATAAAPRVRRDPGLLVELLCAPLTRAATARR